MSTLTQPTVNANPAIITESQFYRYTTSWMEALEGPNDGLLQSCFTLSDSADTPNKWLGRFYFKADDIISVLSTVGLHTIMIQFGIKTDHSLFTPILVGYNRGGLQVTPYYVGQKEGSLVLGQMQTPDLMTDYTSDQVPDVLANTWIAQWVEVATIDKSLFHTPLGYLRGYTFLMQDFLDALSLLKSDKDTFVVVYLALHQYLGSDGQQNSTFGLVIGAQNNATHLPDSDSRANTISRQRQVYYDLSAPCPPTCRSQQLQ